MSELSEIQQRLRDLREAAERAFTHERRSAINDIKRLIRDFSLDEFDLGFKTRRKSRFSRPNLPASVARTAKPSAAVVPSAEKQAVTQQALGKSESAQVEPKVAQGAKVTANPKKPPGKASEAKAKTSKPAEKVVAPESAGDKKRSAPASKANPVTTRPTKAAKSGQQKVQGKLFPEKQAPVTGKPSGKAPGTAQKPAQAKVSAKPAAKEAAKNVAKGKTGSKGKPAATKKATSGKKPADKPREESQEYSRVPIEALEMDYSNLDLTSLANE